MRRARRVFFKMDACDSDATELAPCDEGVFVLANLIPLRDIGVEVTLAIKLGDVSERAAKRYTHAQDMLYCFTIDDWQGPRVRKADGADVDIRAPLVRVIATIAKHLGAGCELGVDLKPDGGDERH